MIQYADGSIFDQDGVAVIPVNTVGVTGAGLANAWARLNPQRAQQYQAFCANPRMPFEGGDILMLGGTPPTFLAATKEHWRDPSRLEWIETCAEHIAERSRKPIGLPVLIPQLGCGLGGLRWEDVRPILIRHLEPNTNNAYVFFGPSDVRSTNGATR